MLRAHFIGLGYYISNGYYTVRRTGFDLSRKTRLSAISPKPAEKGNLIFGQLQHETTSEVTVYITTTAA